MGVKASALLVIIWAVTATASVVLAMGLATRTAVTVSMASAEVETMLGAAVAPSATG
jgi:hypothetical protein